MNFRTFFPSCLDVTEASVSRYFNGFTKRLLGKKQRGKIGRKKLTGKWKNKKYKRPFRFSNFSREKERRGLILNGKPLQKSFQLTVPKFPVVISWSFDIFNRKGVLITLKKVLIILIKKILCPADLEKFWPGLCRGKQAVGESKKIIFTSL